MTGYESKKAMAQDKITDEQGRPMTYWGGKAQPEQEPVAYTLNCVCGAVWDIKADGSEEMAHTPDTTPPQRTWVDLTDGEIDAIYLQHHNQYDECESPNWGYERAIEAKLKQKNGCAEEMDR